MTVIIAIDADFPLERVAESVAAVVHNPLPMDDAKHPAEFSFMFGGWAGEFLVADEPFCAVPEEEGQALFDSLSEVAGLGLTMYDNDGRTVASTPRVPAA